MTIHLCGKIPEHGYDLILDVEPRTLCIVHTHHELKVVDNDMFDVMNIHCMGHGLKKCSGSYKINT